VPLRFAPWFAVALLVCIAQPALGHLDNGDGGRYVVVGTFRVGLNAQPYPIFLGVMTRFSATITRNSSIEYPPARLEVIAPSGATQTQSLVHQEGDFTTQSFPFKEKGNHSVRIIVEDAGRSSSVVVNYWVYPDLPFRFLINTDAEPAAHRPFPFEVRVINATSHRPGDFFTDLSMRWRGVYGPESGEATFNRTGPGQWLANVTMPRAAVYEAKLRSQSGRFGPHDVPSVRFFAVEPSSPKPTTRSPGPGAVALLGLVLVLVAARPRR
jgi:hypothetical protein